MKINIDNLVIRASRKPLQKWNHIECDWENYRVYGYLDRICIGHITIVRASHSTQRIIDDYFFNVTNVPPMPKPYVSYQETEEEYRGNGICGKLIIFANEFYRDKLGTTLYSDTLFIQDFKHQAMRVWEKLEENGLAVYEPYITYSGNIKPRWFLL
jgi:hypothetical protein